MPHELPIDTVLDLHTFAPRDVKSLVEEYLRAASEAGLTEIRLIHGRGTGTQRAIVQAVLEKTSTGGMFPGCSRISSWRDHSKFEDRRTEVATGSPIRALSPQALGPSRT